MEKKGRDYTGTGDEWGRHFGDVRFTDYDYDGALLHELVRIRKEVTTIGLIIGFIFALNLVVGVLILLASQQ